eukprot:m.138842 g.138842  ORF g.138842 m.138842 type:complete len:1065 (-) comp20285_c0_seq3:49-3243(-)
MTDVDDLAVLSDLTEQSILQSLEKRFQQQRIYTYVGDILLAVNPYQQLDLYDAEAQRKYTGQIQKREHAPHVFYLANNAYESMLRDKADQCFVISGESGAGKTETTKFIVSHVIELCRAGKKELENNIRMLNPLLEAFGNAKTAMNNNSSRFGKYLELKFSSTGAVTGAVLSEYLLEKSRVCSQAAVERNYHVFYYVFAGLGPIKLQRYGLTKAGDYKYLNGPGAPDHDWVMSADNLTRFNEMINTLESMKFEESDVESIFKIVAAILHLGNTAFEESDNDAARLTSDASVLKYVTDLLEVNADQLRNCLLTSSSEAAGETIVRNLKKTQADDNRDAISKTIYARLFGWLVTSCNSMLSDPEGDGERTLAILDIFGFEDFAVNSLEQLCINVANEQLQFYFNNYIFAMEQAEYEKQGVQFARIEYQDNTPTLDLFVEKKEGIFFVLDEESRFPKATDLTFTQKLAALKDHRSGAFVSARSNQELSFAVTHYAAKVTYTTENFLEKNRDSISRDVTACLRHSSNVLVSAMFAAPLTKTGTFKVNKAKRAGAAGGNKTTTLGSSFLESLSDLMAKLNSSTPHFVRCVKPNMEKKPALWEASRVATQLKYAGVLETVKIRRMGYSVRTPFADFAKHYRSIAFKYHEKVPGTLESCQQILTDSHLKDYAFGHDKVFLKYYHTDELLILVRKRRDALMFVQNVLRGFIARQRYVKVRALSAQQKTMVQALLAQAETMGDATSQRAHKSFQADEAEREKRKWLKALQKKEEELRKKEQKELEKQAKKEAAAAAAAAKDTITKTKAKTADGGHVWVRNENLTLRVGKLPAHWEKKLDPKTGRPYYKNHQTRETTWVDPRSALTRKQDAKDTEGDELPYGWDEAEINGETYFIDHNTQTTHWLHPRLLLEEKREEYDRLQRDTEQKAVNRRNTIKQFREKKKRLEQLRAQAADEEERQEVEKRVAAIDEVIGREVNELSAISNENKGLKDEIQVLKTQFAKAAYEAKHGEGSYKDESEAELYPVSRPANDTMPRLDTMQKNRLRKSVVNVLALDGQSDGSAPKQESVRRKFD